MRFLRALLVLAALAVSSGAMAQSNLPPIPLLRGPLDPGAMQGTLNLIIQEINNILIPLFPQQPGTEVNFFELNPGLTGQPVVLALQPGGDANAAIAIQPNGNGNVVLFGQGLAGQQSLARLQIGNQSSWVPTAGLTSCPGTGNSNSKATALGVGPTVTGFFLMVDWLGRQHAVAGCG
jgi:hypothetical protein